MSTITRKYFFILMLFLLLSPGIFAQDLGIELNQIYFYNADRVPWYPGFLKAAGIHIPLGAELELELDLPDFIPGGDTSLLMLAGGGLDERDYYLTPQAVVDANPSAGLVKGSPLDPDLAGNEAYTSLAAFEADAGAIQDTADNYVGEYAQLRAVWGIGLHQNLNIELENSRPMSLSLLYAGIFTRNIMDDEMLSTGNRDMEKNQLIFLSEEPDRRNALINRFILGFTWDMLEGDDPRISHGMMSGYSLELEGELAPAFLNASIDPGHSSEEISFPAVTGTTAAYYKTSLKYLSARPLFDLAPEQETNLFSAYLASEFSVGWFDSLGSGGRIPLEIRGDEYTRRFHSEASLSFNSQLPEFSFVRSYWNTRLRYRYDNEFASNPAYYEYVDSDWDSAAAEYLSSDAGSIAIDQGAAYFETELYMEFASAAKLGARFIWDFSSTDTQGPDNSTVQANPLFELEILFP